MCMSSTKVHSDVRPSERRTQKWRNRPHRVIRVLLAEDQVMFRTAVRRLLELEDDIEVIAEVGRGDEVVDSELAARALRAGISPLSSREAEMLGACAEGLSTAELATRFWLSEGTVRNRVSEILGKLGVRTRLEAVQIARDSGWL